MARAMPSICSNNCICGMVLISVITFEGNVHVISVVGGGVETPTKKPFKKANSQFKGKNKTEINVPILEKIYRIALKKSYAICSKLSIEFFCLN